MEPDLHKQALPATRGRQRTTEALDRIARAEARDILKSMVIAAKAGDVQAARLILDRVWASPRSAAITVALRPTRNAAEVRDAMHELLARAAAGEIPTADAEAMFSMMKDIFIAHTAEARLPFAASGPVAPITNARQMLVDRLNKQLERQNKIAASQPATIEITAIDEPNAG